MIHEGPTPLDQIGWIFLVILLSLPAIALALGCLRATWYFFGWIRVQSVSTKWLTFTLPLLPPVAAVVSSWNQRTMSEFTALSIIFSVFVVVGIGSTLFVATLLHSAPAVKSIARQFLRLPHWHKALLAVVLLDLILFRALRG